MQRYVVEREFMGVGLLTPAQPQDIAKTTNAVPRELGPGIL